MFAFHSSIDICKLHNAPYIPMPEGGGSTARHGRGTFRAFQFVSQPSRRNVPPAGHFSAHVQTRVRSQQLRNLARIFGEKEVSSARSSSPDLTRSCGRAARDRSTRAKYRRVVFDLLTRRISAKSAFADDSWGKCPSCPAITSSLCKSDG